MVESVTDSNTDLYELAAPEATMPVGVLPQQAVIQRSGPSLSIRGPREAMTRLFRCLRSVEHVLSSDSDRGCYVSQEVQWLTKRIDDGGANAGYAQLGTFAGLEPAIRCLLSEHGIAAVENTSDGAWSAEPDYDRLASLGPVDQDLLAAVQNRDRAVVRYGREVDQAWLIAQIALAYPDKTIVVAASHRQGVADLAKGVRQWLPVTALLGQDEPAWEDRVVIGTYSRLGAGCVAIHCRDILIAADAVEILGEQGRLAMNHAMRARFYGFLPHSTKPAAADQDFLRCYFGFEEIDIPRRGCHRLPVDIVRIKIAGGPNLAASLDELTLLERGIWCNPLRNRLIAKVAMQLRNGQCSMLEDSPATAAMTFNDSRPRVAILVDTIDHAVELAKLLSDWPVIAGENVSLARLSKDEQRLFRQRSTMKNDSNDQRIVTSCMAGNLNLTQLDILIRVDGGVGLPAIPDGNYVVANGVQRRLLLVDMNDRHHPWLRRRSRQRSECYAQNGWYAPGADPVAERVQEFLAAHGGGQS
jgi:hypothetical protein